MKFRFHGCWPACYLRTCFFILQPGVCCVLVGRLRLFGGWKSSRVRSATQLYPGRVLTELRACLGNHMGLAAAHVQVSRLDSMSLSLTGRSDCHCGEDRTSCRYRRHHWTCFLLSCTSFCKCSSGEEQREESGVLGVPEPGGRGSLLCEESVRWIERMSAFTAVFGVSART